MIAMKALSKEFESIQFGLQKIAVSCQAPTRIDFAGGTLDVWPVAEVLRSLSNPEPLLNVQTINAGIGLFTRCCIEATNENTGPVEHEGIDVFVSDENHSARYDLPSDYSEFKVSFPLVAKVFRHFHSRLVQQGKRKIKIHTESDVPRGSGLGGSSSLFVCLIAAFEKTLGNSKPDPVAIAKLACNLEAGLLGGLAGIQDHLGAAFGGVSSFLFGADDPIRLEFSSQTADWIENHCILALSQDVHHSGSSNWHVLRSFLNSNKETIQLFLKLAENADNAALSLKNQQYEKFQEALSNDWNLRKGVFPGLSTESLDLILMNCMRAGALGAKVCGAAAGGVMLVTFDGSISMRRNLENAIQQSNARILPLNIVQDGVKVESRPPKQIG